MLHRSNLVLGRKGLLVRRITTVSVAARMHLVKETIRVSQQLQSEKSCVQKGSINMSSALDCVPLIVLNWTILWSEAGPLKFEAILYSAKTLE